jgi:integrase
VLARSADPAFKRSTIKKYNSLIIALSEYESIYDCKILFHDITSDFIDSFKNYLYHTRKVNTATLGKYLAKIRTFARLASKAKMPIPDDYKDLKIKDYKAYNIYLTLSELSNLYNFEYRSPFLRNAVDLFCISAFTGLRFGDVYSLKQENIKQINGKDMIYLQQEKTGHDPIIIPLHHIVKDILARNKGIPHKISNQKLNKYIKEAASIAGITHNIIHYYNKAGKDTSIVIPKCDLVTTHTARRSMITNMVIQGIPNSLIMKISGHRTEAAFRRYLCLENEQAAILLADHDFFK